MTLLTSDADRIPRAIDALSEAWQISDTASANTPLIRERIAAASGTDR